jgi:hypothetical protein
LFKNRFAPQGADTVAAKENSIPTKLLLWPMEIWRNDVNPRDGNP